MGHILPAGHLLARGERAQVRFSNSTSREMPWIMQLRIIATKRCLSRESRELPLTSSRTSMQTRLNNRTRVCSARKMQGRTCTKRERKRSLRIPILRPLFFHQNYSSSFRRKWTVSQSMDRSIRISSDSLKRQLLFRHSNRATFDEFWLNIWWIPALENIIFRSLTKHNRLIFLFAPLEKINRHHLKDSRLHRQVNRVCSILTLRPNLISTQKWQVSDK